MISNSTTGPMQALQPQTFESIAQVLALKAKAYVDRFLSFQRGPRGRVMLQPILKLSERGRLALLSLKGSIGGDDRLRVTREQIRDLLGGASDSTLARRGRELWGAGNPARLFDRQVITDESTGRTFWVLKLRRCYWHWMQRPAAPDHAALDHELEQISDGYQPPQKWHRTPFGCIPDNGRVYSEYTGIGGKRLADGKLLQFPTGELVDPPPWWDALERVRGDGRPVTADTPPVTADRGTNKVEEHTNHTEDHHTKRENAAPLAQQQTAPRPRRQIPQGTALALTNALREDALKAGIPADAVDTQHAKFIDWYRRHRRTPDAEAWHSWCLQDFAPKAATATADPLARLGENAYTRETSERDRHDDDERLEAPVDSLTKAKIPPRMLKRLRAVVADDVYAIYAAVHEPWMETCKASGREWTDDEAQADLERHLSAWIGERERSA